MAVNPMQRKANNSFLLGMVITLLITGIIIAFLIMQISNLNKEREEKNSMTQYAYVITSEIKSGTEIQPTQVKGIELQSEVKSTVLYSAKVTEADGTVSADTTGARFPAGLKAKVDLHPGTIVSSDIIYEDEPIGNDVRTQEYNIITMLSQLTTGDYVDIRLRLTTGQDYIVVSHKEVTIPQVNGVESTNCMWLNLREDEILTMSSAIVEAYRAEGTMLYATKYVEPGMQQAAQLTYIPNNEVIQLINQDKNIVDTAKSEIFIRNNDPTNKGIIRNPIDALTKNDEADDNVVAGVRDEIQGLQEEREDYLESLGG